ncbi:MAG: glycerol kinase GlpK [Acidobacteriota bacterium]
MKHAVLALDQGTTSSRAIVFAADGTVLAVAQQEFTQHFPRSGWVEHDADEIASTQIAVATEALTRARLAASDLAAIGITNQRETTIVWDRATGRPIHRAIVWQDRRTAERCRALDAEGVGETVTAKTGLLLDSYFSATKIEWILDHVDGARARAEAGELVFGTVDTWLVWQLTRGALHITDASNASRTLLFDIHRGTWDEELCTLFRVPMAMLPEVVPSSARYGDAEVLGGSIPISGIAGDQQAALFGQMCTSPGMAKNTYGTGCFLLLNTGDDATASANRLVTTTAWRLEGADSYALEGSIFVGGAVVQWLRDGLKMIRRSEDIEALAAQVPDADGVFLVPAFTGLGAPYWDPHARGTLVGLTRATTDAHLARAALDSIALQSADVLDAMVRDAGIELAELRVDGGAARNNLLMQRQADILGVPVVRPANAETTALGAAFLAGLGVGFWTLDACAAQWRVDRRFEPASDSGPIAELRDGWRRAVERSRDWEPNR